MMSQLVDHIYNSLVQDLNYVMNPSIALEIVKFLFFVVALHESNLTTTCGNLLSIKVLGEPMKYNLVSRFLFIEYEND